MKNEIIQSIISKLSDIGIKVTNNEITDIQIDTEFLDAKWSTGEKKIEFHSLAYLNESDSTIYYWQMTKDISSGFSFGSDSENSFQSGNTIFRKVKSVGYGPDGKAFEYTIDLGAITKIFKEVAKENNLKFKTVLNKNKAMYDNKKVTDKTSPAFVKIKSETKKPNIENIIENKSKPNTNENKFRFKFPFTFLAVIFGLLLLIVKIGFFGWIVFGITFFFIYSKRNKILEFNMFKNIFIWIMIFVILSILLLFVTPKSNNVNNKNEKEYVKIPITETTYKNEVESTTQSNQNDSPFSLTSYSISAIPGYDDVGFRMAGDLFKVNPNITYLVNLSINYDVNNTDKKPVSIKLFDSKIVNKPKIGKYNLVVASDGNWENREEYINKYKIKNGYVLGKDMFGGNLDSGYYILSLGLFIYDTKEYIYPIDTTSINSSNAITDAGYTSDDVRSKIYTKIEIKCKDGTTYYMPIELELLSGDFLENNQLLSDKHLLQDEYIKFFKK